MIYSWLYVFINAISALLRQIFGSAFSPALILLVGSIVAIIFFHLLNFKKIKYTYQKCWLNKMDWLSLNVSIAIIWGCAIYSPSYIGASLYTFLFFATLGLMGMVALSMKKDSFKVNDLISIFVVFGLLCYVLFFIPHIGKNQALGITLACAGGISGFIYSKQSALFMKHSQLNATQILSVRFYLAVILSLFLLPKAALFSYPMYHLSFAIITGILCFILPIYLAQKGIEKAGPEVNSIISSSTPLLAALVERVYTGHLEPKLFIIYLLYSIFSIIYFKMSK